MVDSREHHYLKQNHEKHNSSFLLSGKQRNFGNLKVNCLDQKNSMISEKKQFDEKKLVQKEHIDNGRVI